MKDSSVKGSYVITREYVDVLEEAFEGIKIIFYRMVSDAPNLSTEEEKVWVKRMDKILRDAREAEPQVMVLRGHRDGRSREH